MPDEVIQQLIESGLLFRIAGLSARELQNLYRQLELLHYCRMETASQPDANMAWLRLYQRN